jgi:predicted MFS family arabinose efflux permease
MPVRDFEHWGGACMAVTDTGAGPRQRADFRRFWVAGAVNRLGSHMSGLALPIVVLAAGGGPATAGLVGTVGAAAELVASPAAGVYADRWPRRAMLVGSALLAAVAMGSVAVGVAWHAVPLALLFLAAAVEGLATSAYAAAASGAIRAVLPAENPEAAVGALQAREQGAQLVGPGVGGGLYQLAPWAPFLADAVSYLVAAGCVRGIRTDLGPSARGTGPSTFRADLAEGVRYVLGKPFLRFVAVWAGGVNLVIGGLYFFVIVVARLRGSAPGTIGAVLTAAGLAGLAGALLGPALLRRVKPRVVVVVASWVLVGAVALAWASTTLWAYAVMLGAVSAAVPVLSILFQSKAILGTPDGVQARVATALDLSSRAAGAASPLLAGALAATLAPATAAACFAVALAGLAVYATREATASEHRRRGRFFRAEERSERGAEQDDTAGMGR